MFDDIIFEKKITGISGKTEEEPCKSTCEECKEPNCQPKLPSGTSSPDGTHGT